MAEIPPEIKDDYKLLKLGIGKMLHDLARCPSVKKETLYKKQICENIMWLLVKMSEQRSLKTKDI